MAVKPVNSWLGLTVKVGNMLGLIIDRQGSAYLVELEDGRQITTSHVKWETQIPANPKLAKAILAADNDGRKFEVGDIIRYDSPLTTPQDALFEVTGYGPSLGLVSVKRVFPSEGEPTSVTEGSMILVEKGNQQNQMPNSLDQYVDTPNQVENLIHNARIVFADNEWSPAMPSYSDGDGNLWIWDSSSKSYVKGHKQLEDRVDRSHATGGDNDLFDPVIHREKAKNPLQEGILASTQDHAKDCRCEECQLEREIKMTPRQHSDASPFYDRAIKPNKMNVDNSYPSMTLSGYKESTDFHVKDETSMPASSGDTVKKYQEFSHFREEMHHNANKPNLDECPECGLPMTTHREEAVCHGCGHKQPVVTVHARKKEAFGVGDVASGAWDAAKGAGGFVANHPLASALMAGTALAAIPTGGASLAALPEEAAAAGAGEAALAGGEAAAGGAEAATGAETADAAENGGGILNSARRGMSAAKGKISPKINTYLKVKGAESALGSGGGMAGGGSGGSQMMDYSQGQATMANIHHAMENEEIFATKNRGDDSNPDIGGTGGYNAEHGDSPELLKDVNGSGGTTDLDQDQLVSIAKKLAESLSPDQAEAFEKFDKHLPIIIEYSQHEDLDGEEHPELKNLMDLWERVFPGTIKDHEEGKDSKHESDETPKEEHEEHESPKEELEEKKSNMTPPTLDSGPCQVCGATGPCPHKPAQFKNPASGPTPLAPNPMQASTRSSAWMEKTALRIPKNMCPFHKQLVEHALAIGDPTSALTALNSHMFGEQSCQGSYEHPNGKSCKYKPAMVTQQFWDDKETAAQERRELREQQALEAPVSELPADSFSETPLNGDLTAIDSFGGDSPSMDSGSPDMAIGDMQMAASYRIAGEHVCPMCDGKGTGNHGACETCHGSGEVDDEHEYKESAHHLADDDDCSSCDGKGEVMDAGPYDYATSCKACDGTGKKKHKESSWHLADDHDDMDDTNYADHQSNSTWTDSAGHPLKRGHDYMLKAPTYEIPDHITVDEVHPDKISFTIHTDMMDYRDEMDRNDLQTQGYEFKPANDVPHSEVEKSEDFDPETNDDNNMEGAMGHEVSDLSSTDTKVSHTQHPQRSWLWDDADFAETHLAGRDYSPSEQRSFVNESGVARNLDRLSLENTHYIEENNLDDSFLW